MNGSFVELVFTRAQAEAEDFFHHTLVVALHACYASSGT